MRAERSRRAFEVGLVGVVNCCSVARLGVGDTLGNNVSVAVGRDVIVFVLVIDALQLKTPVVDAGESAGFFGSWE